MSAAILLMAYGSPESADDVGPYFTHIRGGRRPPPEAIERLQRRYEIVGGRTPLLDITNRVRAALEEEVGQRVYVGMKHWHPFVADTVQRMVEDGVTEVTAIALAPHYSRMSVGGYRKSLDDAIAAVGRPLAVRFVEHWHMHPSFVELIARRTREALSLWQPAERAQVVTLFSAHSLPERIRTWDDPYERQLLASCHAVATEAGIGHWRFVWQSAGHTDEPWLGPDIVEALSEIHGEGVRHVLSVPIGFVSDHLEIFYDLDFEARRAAESLGITFRRTRMPNDDPAFVKTLADIARVAA
jgi:protoporphyrin/coproporphyrin ferrochelatase